MDHKIMEEKLQMYFFDELSSEEKTETENHLKECNECRAALEEFKKIKAFLSLKKQYAEDSLLLDARRQLRLTLKNERAKGGFLKVLDFRLFREFRPSYALSGLLILITGVFIGYLFTGQSGENTPERNIPSEFSASRINNLRFIDSDASDGEIEFIYDAVRPVKVKGSVNDEEIKSLLMHAMLNEQNPGVRLSSVNFVTEANPAAIDSEVKTAVITVAKFDQNPGVRKEALSFLKKLPYDDHIKQAYLYILMNDSVSGLRIEAINGLFQASEKGELFSEEELSVFKEKIKGDDNSYIRFRAQTVLEEYN